MGLILSHQRGISKQEVGKKGTALSLVSWYALAPAKHHAGLTGWELPPGQWTQLPLPPEFIEAEREKERCWLLPPASLHHPLVAPLGPTQTEGCPRRRPPPATQSRVGKGDTMKFAEDWMEGVTEREKVSDDSQMQRLADGPALGRRINFCI